MSFDVNDCDFTEIIIPYCTNVSAIFSTFIAVVTLASKVDLLNLFGNYVFDRVAINYKISKNSIALSQKWHNLKYHIFQVNFSIIIASKYW